MSRIELRHIHKYYGKNHILKDINLTIEDGDFVTLLGPSGCGKTTTLRIISGLENPQEGCMHMDGREIINAAEAHFEPPAKRGLNLVFQSYALWPHMTVFDNVAFGLRMRKMPKPEIKEKVMAALGRMQIQQYSKRFPSELSGGQQQRVAIARSIVSEPQLLLLDEPLSNLDAKLRVDMRAELKRLHEETKMTVIYVTHDQVEALTMSTKIAIFFSGELVQVDTPQNLYNNPADLRVAEFIGNPSINFVNARCTLTDAGFVTAGELGKLVFNAAQRTDHPIPKGEFQAVIGIRPEQLTLEKKRITPADIEAEVTSCMPAGSETMISVRVGNTKLTVKEVGYIHLTPGIRVYLQADPNRFILFDKASGRLIKRAKIEE